MATKKRNTEQVHVAAEEAMHETPAQTVVETQEASVVSENPVEAASPKLEHLSVLAERHRVPSWQQAALVRFMGWKDGKMASDAEYRAALTGLANRRIGGGHRA